MMGMRRILLNAVALYGRAVCAILCGIFTSRWLLMIFGESDYGLIGVVAGVTVFISFANTILSHAVGRHLAYAVGQTQGHVDVEACRKWFSTACFLHLMVSTLLILIGYPIGSWLVREWLTIPPDRVDACLWFYRISCVQVFCSMAASPFCSVFHARQKMVELSLYSMMTAIIVLLGVFFMGSHSGDCFVHYAVLTNGVMTFFAIVIMVRAMVVFPEFRPRFTYMISKMRIHEIFRVATWQGFGYLTLILKTQGVALLINKIFGPVYNTSFSIATNVSNHVSSLSNSFSTAFSPAIMNLEGAGNREGMISLTFRQCKVCTIICGLFALPLMFEISYVLKLWLVNMPRFADVVCLWFLAFLLLDCLTDGFWSAVNAVGRMGLFCSFVSILNIASLPLMYVAVKLWGVSFVFMFAIMAVMRLVATAVSVKLADDVIGFGQWIWYRSILFPFICVVMLSAAVAGMSRLLMEASFLRLCCTTIFSVVSFLLGVWTLVLSSNEKQVVRTRVVSFWKRGLSERISLI